MKIAVIGAGNIGGTLGKKWAAVGHIINFGVRNPAEAKFDELRASGRVMSVAESLDRAEAILLSLPGAAVAEFAAHYAEALKEMTIIDATNNVRCPVMHSLEALQNHAPGAHLARAFSTLGWENLANPKIGGETIDLFYCAADPAQQIVDRLIVDVGLCPVYLGGLDAAPLLDGLTRVWFALAMGQGRGRRVALKLMQE